MAAFAILFGTRHIDTTEHQDGMILAIAVELIVKLVAFVAVGAVRDLLHDGGFGSLFDRPPHDQGSASASRSGKGLIGSPLAHPDASCDDSPLSSCPGNSTWPWSRMPAAPIFAAPPGCFRSTSSRSISSSCRSRWRALIFLRPGTCRWRHVRAGAAGQRPNSDLRMVAFHRRAFGFDRHGRRRNHRPLDHDLQQSRGADPLLRRHEERPDMLHDMGQTADHDQAAGPSCLMPGCSPTAITG